MKKDDRFKLHAKVKTFLPEGYTKVPVKVSHIGLKEFYIDAGEEGTVVEILPDNFYYVHFIRKTYGISYSINKKFLQEQ